jgi:glutaconyl-CoA decarboxylase
MPGKVLKVAVSVGAAVNAGDLLLVLEAMKMENEIQAPSAGTVKEIKVSDGSPVNTGDVLVVLG